MMGTTNQAELPATLAKGAQAPLDPGWAASIGAVVAEAAQRYLESRSEPLAEQFIRADIARGLDGRD